MSHQQGKLLRSASFTTIQSTTWQNCKKGMDATRGRHQHRKCRPKLIKCQNTSGGTFHCDHDKQWRRITKTRQSAPRPPPSVGTCSVSVCRNTEHGANRSKSGATPYARRRIGVEPEHKRSMGVKPKQKRSMEVFPEHKQSIGVLPEQIWS